MEFEETKCPNCGAPLSVFISLGRAVCESCGNNYYIKNHVSNQMSKLSEKITPYNNISFVYEKTETIHLQSNETNQLRVALLVISGLSYALGKNYKIIIGDKSTYIYQKGEISKEEKKKVLKGKARSAKAAINKVFDRIENNTYNLGLENYISFLSKYNCKKSEDIKHKKENRIISYGEYSSHCECSCDMYYSYIIGELIITPTYFKKYFNTYVDCFERIFNKKEVSIIAERMSASLIKSIELDNQSTYEAILIANNCCFHSYSYIINGYAKKVLDRIAYNDIGMNNINDEGVLFCVCIAIIAKTMMLTKNADCPFDLVQNMLRSNSKPIGIRWDPILKHIEVELKPVKQIVYNEW